MSLVTFTVQDETVTQVRLGVGGAEDTPRRLSQVEEALNDKPLTNGQIRMAAELAANLITPLEDALIPEDYRRQLVKTVVRRALEAARGSRNGQ